MVLLSPAKTLDFRPQPSQLQPSSARFPEQSQKLINALRKLSTSKLSALMDISPDLAKLNRERYLSFGSTESIQSALPAIHAFAGDVYRGLSARDWQDDDLAFAQNHIRVLSGLYGLLRPLDLIEPYRLEMGSALKVGRAQNLYAFWGKQVTQELSKDLQELQTPFVLNLASQEYSQVLQFSQLGIPVWEVNFQELRQGKYRFVSYNAKVARGLMAREIVLQRIHTIDQLKDLDLNGYQYDAERSEGFQLAFTKQA